MDYDKFAADFPRGGLGATGVIEPRLTLFLAFDHPASARFRQGARGWCGRRDCPSLAHGHRGKEKGVGKT